MIRSPSKFTPVYSFEINESLHRDVVQIIRDEEHLTFHIIPYDRLTNEFMDEETFVMDSFMEDLTRGIVRVISIRPFLITKDYDYAMYLTAPDGTRHSIRPGGW